MSEQDATFTLDGDDDLDAIDGEDGDFEDGNLDLDSEPTALPDDLVLQQFVPDDLGDPGFSDDDGLDGAALGGMPPAPPVSMAEERLARLEDAARLLAGQEQAREQGRVHRKVKAATTGAGAAGFVPILLQLVGAMDLPPNLAATATAVASLAGALLAGYLTPEREQPVAASASVQDLLAEGAELSAQLPASGSGAPHQSRRHARRAARHH